MSGYYYASSFKLSAHARVRIRERLTFAPNIGDLELESHFNDLLRDIRPAFVRGTITYYKIPKHQQLYAVVDQNGLVLTVTFFGAHKLGRMYR